MSALPYNLLIIDDFAADRELYRRSLLADSRSRYHPIEAESVAEGLELCQSHAIDGVLLDYMLPDGDGLEFLAAFSKLYESNPPPVVMMTGQGNENIAVRAMKLGAQDYLVKRDVTPAILQLTMRTAIENARLKRQLAKCQTRFQMSIDNMRECVSIFSAIRDDADRIIDFRFDYLNPAALENNRMTGKDLGKSLCEVFPVFRTSDLFAQYCQVVTTGYPLVKEDFVYEDLFGGERLTRVYSVHATKLDDGLVSCWREETAQRQAVKELQVADRKIVDIWESMTDAYVTVDRDWRIIYANPAATQVICHLTNLAPTEFLGRSHWDLFPSLVGGDVEREFRRALSERVAVHLEVWFEPTASWFEAHLYPAAEGLGIYFRDITDRKQLEAERLAATQERDRFFNLSLDLLAVANFDGYFTRLNPAFERVLGFTSHELTTQPFLDFVHPDDRATTVAAAQQLANRKMLVSFENRYRCQDGSYRWLLWSATPDLEKNLIYASGRDITDRKQAEESLRESERKFTAIFDQSFELKGIVSLDGVLLEVNQTALDSIAAQREEIVGQLFWETPWWHTEQLQQQLQAAIARAGKGEFMRYEVQFPHPSGVMLTTDFSLKPVFDETGKVWTIVAEAHDITEQQAALRERKRAERDLLESQERLRTGIEVAGVGLARFDYNTNLVALSPEAAILYGFPPDTTFVSREQIHATFHPDERAELEAIIAQVVDPAGTGWFARDHRVVWPTGEVRCLSVRKQVFFAGVGEASASAEASPVENRVGGVGCPSHAILAAIDITDRNQIQSDLEARNRELDSFVHIVSHDLKAPLRAVANLSKWIEEDLEGSLSVANQEQMNLLRARIERMSATIDGLLDYARIGRTADSIEPVAVGEPIAEAIENLSPPPTFQIAIAKNLPTLYTKRLLLTQVFTNLIGNAIKHHDRIDGTIHIGIAERSNVYEFAIADDGPGIEPEQHDRVFEIFQAINPQNRSDSTGIGLAIVKKIIEAEGGTIRLESQLGQGTTFYFTWPKRS
jgi:PAS domain S-box-containing protein